MGKRGPKPLYGEPTVSLTVRMPPALMQELTLEKKARNARSKREREWWTESRVVVSELAKRFDLELATIESS